MTDVVSTAGDTSGLPSLVDGVAAYLSAAGVAADVVLGWKDKSFQINQGDGRANRIIVQPGDDGGNAGSLTMAKMPGAGPTTAWPPTAPTGGQTLAQQSALGPQQARPLSTWEEIATVYIWAVDPSAPQDQRAAYIAVRQLLQWFRRAVQYVARKNADFGRVKWLVGETESSFGREISVDLVYKSPILDTAEEIVFPTPAQPPFTKVVS